MNKINISFLARGIFFFAAFIIILCLCFCTTSCLTNKTVQKMLEREDAECKQTVKLAVLAANTAYVEKVRQKDTVFVVPEKQIDTFFVYAKDTFWHTITKDKEIIRYKTVKDTIQIQAICPETTQTIHLTDTFISKTVEPSRALNALNKSNDTALNWWFIAFCIAFVSGLGYYIYSKFASK